MYAYALTWISLISIFHFFVFNIVKILRIDNNQFVRIFYTDMPLYATLIPHMILAAAMTQVTDRLSYLLMLVIFSHVVMYMHFASTDTSRFDYARFYVQYTHHNYIFPGCLEIICALIVSHCIHQHVRVHVPHELLYALILITIYASLVTSYEDI
jgi:hypothetical protein